MLWGLTEYGYSYIREPGSDPAMTYELAHRLRAKKWHNLENFKSAS